MENSSAFVSVSLPAATTGWLPRKTSLVGGTLRWSECDYFQRQVSQRILLNGGITPSVNYELTDWMALETFVDDFLESCVRPDEPSLRPTPLLH